MIDTDKYEGHTEGPWDKESDPWVKVNKNRGNGRLFGSVMNVASIKNTTVEDFNLMADAPDLLAEVKRLREAIADTADAIELVTHTEHQRAIVERLRKVIE